MADQMVRALCLSGGIRIIACNASALANEICRLQKTSPTASIALSRGVAAGALMGALLKDDQRVALKFEGNGTLGKLLIEAEYDGAVRGCVGNPSADIEPLNGKWDVAGLIGRAGFLTVSKDLGLGGQVYRGVVQLVTSEIGADIAYYLTDSEQTPSAVGVGATLSDNGEISICGGFLIQALPKSDEAELEKIMARISELPAISTILKDGGVKAVIDQLFADIPYTILESKNIFFRCGCGIEKVEQALLTLGRVELEDMKLKENHAEVTCEFCRKLYSINSTELDKLILAASKQQES